MARPATPAKPHGLALMFGWRRLRFTLGFSLAIGLLMSFGWQSGLASILERTIGLGLIAMIVFGLFEQWPRTLPRWLPRWILQVASVGIAMPIETAVIYWLSTEPGGPAFYLVPDRMEGFGALAGLSTFLFNTLANVQALVDAGSPQASGVLKSLVAYLRAAVPRLNEPATTLGQELQLVQAYLELMHMRMPDRLQFDLRADASTLGLRCPPMTLLTLVENAVRHGIDPSEEGGRIEIEVRREGDRCRIRVSDTGVGLRTSGTGLGTGLATLRERLALVFGSDARLELELHRPRGVTAEMEFPAREAA